MTSEQEQWLQRERRLLADLRELAVRLEAPAGDLALLQQSQAQLDELFLLVVVGEFNAGKTAFLNALLGERLLKEGVLPTTSQIQLLRHSSQPSRAAVSPDQVEIGLSVEWLREINLVDTPGTNAVLQDHQLLTEHFIPRSDLVLFVTSADRPFSESERQLLLRIRGWGKKIVLVINKIDLVEDVADQRQIVEFVAQNGAQLLGEPPRVFPISARLALEAKQAQGGGPLAQNELWQRSRFGELERYLLAALDASERLHLKLSAPLGVAGQLSGAYRQRVDGRAAVLRGDFAAIDHTEAQLVAYEADQRRDFKYHLSHVDNILYEMAERGDRFFNETLRFERLFDLVNSDKVRAEFERAVVAGTSLAVERQVSDLIDWIVASDYRQWQAVMGYLSQRAAAHTDKMVGQVGGSFELNRQALLGSVGRAAQRVVDSYDPQAESLKLTQQVQATLMQTAAVEAGALGLGTLLVAVLNTTLLDITGVLGASALAVLGFYVLPYRRSRLKQELRRAIGALRSQLAESLERQFEKELADSLQRLRASIAPYTRFVRVEREKLEAVGGELDRLQQELAALRVVTARVLPGTELPRSSHG
ncbi:MAG: dynamin family protein [Caldilinea sp.]